MRTVMVRNVKIGEGLPKICVSILGRTKDELYEEVLKCKESCADIIEWRIDAFEHSMNLVEVIKIISMLREVLAETPLLATFRSKREGGQKEVDTNFYLTLNETLCKSGCIDLLDLEYCTGEREVVDMMMKAQSHRVKVILSYHDFLGTPKEADIVSRLIKMQDTGADIIKMAVMPTTKEDVFTLLNATNTMYENYADRPIVTMSMSDIGSISRICGETFGSALSFGAIDKVSAPGQFNVNDLKTILMLMHKHAHI